MGDPNVKEQALVDQRILHPNVGESLNLHLNEVMPSYFKSCIFSYLVKTYLNTLNAKQMKIVDFQRLKNKI